MVIMLCTNNKIGDFRIEGVGACLKFVPKDNAGISLRTEEKKA